VPGRDDLAQARAAFSRAIALDPAYGPAYLHALDLAARTGQRAEAVRTIDAYLALGPTAESAEAARLVRRVLVTTEDGTAGIRIAIDSAPDAVLFTALPFLWDWPDANEADVLIARRLATTREERPYITSSFGDSLLRRRWAALILAHHGPGAKLTSPAVPRSTISLACCSGAPLLTAAAPGSAARHRRFRTISRWTGS